MPSISLYEPVVGPAYYEYSLSCNKSHYHDHPKHASIICDIIAEGQRDDGNRKCGQYIMNEYSGESIRVWDLTSSCRFRLTHLGMFSCNGRRNQVCFSI